MRREQMDRDLLSGVGQPLHVCFVWHHRCHCINVMKLVLEVLARAHTCSKIIHQIPYNGHIQVVH